MIAINCYFNILLKIDMINVNLE